MAVRKRRPTSPGVRHSTVADAARITKGKPVKSLVHGLRKRGGRNATGKITTRHQGGGHKRLLRRIDFTRDKRDIPGRVMAIEYDPNRRADLALIFYADGEKRYIIAPANLTIGETVVAGDHVEVKTGNTLPLGNIPVGTPIHNIELRPGKGGQLVRGAGAAAAIQAKEGKYATVQLPSKEIRLIDIRCYATIGQVGNVEWRSMRFGKAGRKRHMGIRPSVRGVAMHPAAHPHGGGEGRSGVGMPSPKSPWGKPTLGKKTRSKRKYSDKFIIKDRRVK